MADTDRTLLERAAKAEGHAYPWVVPDRGGERPWNPLTDDGDALRLFTRLPFRELYVSEIGVTVSWRRSEEGKHGLKCDEFANEHGGDMLAATRRAIVRAAAAMGGGNG